MKLFISALVFLSVVACTKQQAKTAVPVVETGVDVAVALCSQFEPQWAWVCKLTDTELDTLLDSLFAKMEMHASNLAAVDRATKEDAILTILEAKRKQ